MENGSLIIDQSRFADTGDKYFFDNHFYSDKPPILAIYASPIYFVLNTAGISFDRHSDIACYLVTLFTIGTLSAAGLTVFRKVLKDFFEVSDEWADAATFVTGAGTLILPYSLVFNNHVSSGVLLFFGFYQLLLHRRTGKLENVFLSGFLLSFAGSIDINCFLFIPFSLILFLRRSVTAGLAFGIACVPMIALYLCLNLYTSGSLTPPAMNAALWDYPGSAFNQDTLSGLAEHENLLAVLFYAFHALIANRGLISHSPILLLSISGLFLIYSGRFRFQYKREYGFLLIASLLYIAIYLLRTTNYSGWAFGIRWFASLMLILCLPLGSLEVKFRSSKRWRTVFNFLASVSVLIAIAGSYKPFTPLDETETQFSPTNTILASIRQITTDSLKILTASATPGELLRITQLILGAVVIFFLLYRSLRNLKPINSEQPKQPEPALKDLR